MQTWPKMTGPKCHIIPPCLTRSSYQGPWGALASLSQYWSWWVRLVRLEAARSSTTHPACVTQTENFRHHAIVYPPPLVRYHVSRCVTVHVGKGAGKGSHHQICCVPLRGGQLSPARGHLPLLSRHGTWRCTKGASHRELRDNIDNSKDSPLGVIPVER